MRFRLSTVLLISGLLALTVTAVGLLFFPKQTSPDPEFQAFSASKTSSEKESVSAPPSKTPATPNVLNSQPDSSAVPENETRQASTSINSVSASNPGSRWSDAFLSATNSEQFAAVAQQFAALSANQIGPEEIAAAREILNRVASSELQGGDVGPIFRALQHSSDPNLISEFVSRIPQWQYYATFALSEMPNAQGIPALVQQLQLPDSQTGESRYFILEILAQDAAGNPDAANAILDQARSNRLTKGMWQRVALGLGGDQYIMTAPVTPSPNLKTYHMAAGNQNFFSLPLSPADGQLPQRLSLVEQLLNLTTDPTVASFLLNARDNLTKSVAALSN